MNLYRVQFDSDSDYVEANSFAAAVKVWQDYTKERGDWGDDGDAEEPDGVELVQSSEVMRAVDDGLGKCEGCGVALNEETYGTDSEGVPLCPACKQSLVEEAKNTAEQSAGASDTDRNCHTPRAVTGGDAQARDQSILGIPVVKDPSMAPDTMKWGPPAALAPTAPHDPCAKDGHRWMLQDGGRTSVCYFCNWVVSTDPAPVAPVIAPAQEAMPKCKLCGALPVWVSDRGVICETATCRMSLVDDFPPEQWLKLHSPAVADRELDRAQRLLEFVSAQATAATDGDEYDRGVRDTCVEIKHKLMETFELGAYRASQRREVSTQ